MLAMRESSRSLRRSVSREPVFGAGGDGGHRVLTALSARCAGIRGPAFVVATG